MNDIEHDPMASFDTFAKEVRPRKFEDIKTAILDDEGIFRYI